MSAVMYDLQRLEQLIAAAQTLEETDVPAVVLPSGAGVESLEHLLSTPMRMRQTFTTERLSDFCRYVGGEAGSTDDAAGVAVFVRPDGSGAEAVIDYGTHNSPLWGQHRARLVMRHTPEFAGLLGIVDKRLGQRDLIEWLEDWGRIITPYRGDEEISLAQAISVIRRIDIKEKRTQTHETGEWSAVRSSLEEIEATSSGDVMPDGFRIKCQLYPETQEREITTRLSLLTGDDAPTLRLRIVGFDRLRQEVAEEVELVITNQLGATTRVFCGSVQATASLGQ